MKPTEHEMAVSHLRDGLGMVYQHVARTDEPVVITRYGKADVVLVPLWEWRFFKQLEADIRAGRKHLLVPEDSPEIGPEVAGTGAERLVTDCPDAGRRSPRDHDDPMRENHDGDQDDEEGPGEEGDPEEA
jgi:prevent-host-death family protein